MKVSLYSLVSDLVKEYYIKWRTLKDLDVEIEFYVQTQLLRLSHIEKIVNYMKTYLKSSKIDAPDEINNLIWNLIHVNEKLLKTFIKPQEWDLIKILLENRIKYIFPKNIFKYSTKYYVDKLVDMCDIDDLVDNSYLLDIDIKYIVTET